MMSKSQIVLAGAILVIFVLPLSIQAASAQYLGNVGPNGETGANTLESTLKAAHDRVLMAQQEGAYGSGTPYFAADGVLGASLLTASVFGGISAAFFVRGRKGKYAAPGMG